ncbi:MAG: hypothetical protein EHM35_19910, partial [Planctomycetaceae bacterium]
MNSRSRHGIAHLVPKPALALSLAGLVSGVSCVLGDSLDQWTVRTSGTGNNLDAVAYGAGRFVAVGQNGTILLATNGVNWAASTSSPPVMLHGVAWGLNTFVAVGDAGTILTSPDGVTWTPQ